MLELYHNDMSTCAQKVRAHLGEKGVDWTGHELNLRAGDQHKPDFLKLNPKGVVPVLVHDGAVVTESNIIMEYIEDAIAGGPKLMPSDPLPRAAVRAWLQRLDAGLHLDIAVISIGVAFRDQLMAVNNTPELLQAFFDNIPDPKLRAIYQDVVPHGAASAQFANSLTAWAKTIRDIDTALQSGPWLAGGDLTIADFGYLPYFCRLQHLQLDNVWAACPRAASWFARIQETQGYKVGIEKWLNPKYLELMAQTGTAVRGKADDILQN